MVSFQQAFGKAYLAPPGVPVAQVSTLRAAFEAALADKDLLAEAERLRIEIAPQSGESVQSVVQGVYAAPVPVIARLKAIIEP
jgi:tripartite-type tricarboxylate transporter receptor subunit TctC